MRMIAGFLVPTSGSARVCGYDVSREPLKAKRALGYLPEGAPSYGEMTVREFLQFIVRMRGLKAEAGYRRFGAVVQKLQLEEVLGLRSEEHTSELQSLMRKSYAAFCLKNNHINAHV